MLAWLHPGGQGHAANQQDGPTTKPCTHTWHAAFGVLVRPRLHQLGLCLRKALAVQVALLQQCVALFEQAILVGSARAAAQSRQGKSEDASDAR